MEYLYLAFALFQTLGVSLGVGASTIAVANYIIAVADGNVDQSEKRLMKMVYTVLRIAMITILITMIGQAVILYSMTGTYLFHPAVATAWLAVLMLFVNAALMTMRMMPKFLGPALQAGSWYTLAILYFLATSGLGGFSFTAFLAGYLAMIVIAMVVINGTLAYCKTRV